MAGGLVEKSRMESQALTAEDAQLLFDAVMQIRNFTVLRRRQHQDMARIHEMCDRVLTHEA